MILSSEHISVMTVEEAAGLDTNVVMKEIVRLIERKTQLRGLRDRSKIPVIKALDQRIDDLSELLVKRTRR